MYLLRLNNHHMLRMKMHYILYLGGVAGVQGFWPTIAKQLGYSPMVVGSLYTYLSILVLLVKPISGIIVDKFPVKRIMFLTVILTCGLAAFSLNFVQELPTETAGVLHCDATTVLKICSDNDNELSHCDSSLAKRIKISKNNPVKCRLICQKNKSFWNETCDSWHISDYCKSTNYTFKNNYPDYVNLSTLINLGNKVDKNVILQVKSVEINERQIVSPVCRRPVSTRCEIDCSDNIIMQLATIPRSKYQNIFHLYEFWKYFIIMSIFWISQAIIWNLQDPICFDLLGDKPNDFGKQRCWGSISWGIFSIFGGILVDHFSDNDSHKNYTPIFFLCLIITLLDVVLASKLKITETVGSKSTFSDILKLITKFNVVIYFLWIISMGIFTSIPWNYLCWYMEDITFHYQSSNQSWIKTLQGFAVGIQCLGELPFLFFSGWFIERIGHRYCMSLGLFVFAIRFFLYSVITNPIWILPVELTNGLTYGLCHAVLLSHARIIAPPNVASTVVGFAGALFEGVGTSIGGLLGGYLYDSYGGAWTFRLFSYGSLSMGVLHVVFTNLVKVK